jgi:hypothetical protein
MSTESNDQDRVGFEAWARKETFSLELDGAGCYLFSDTLAAWSAWRAAKSEASTEPSAIQDVLFDGHEVYAEITRKLGNSHCHNHETVSATLDAVVRLMRKAGRAGALSDDATSLLAAKKAHQAIVDEKKKMEDAYIESSRLHELYWEIKGAERILAAIEAHKTGSGKGER